MMVGLKLIVSGLLLASLGACRVLGDSNEECNHGEILRVTGIGLKPYFDAQLSSDGLPTGVDMDIVRILAKTLGLDVSFKLSSTWGVKRNGSWTGTVGEVVNGSGDLGIGHLFLDQDRQRDIDFLTPMYDTSAYLVTSQPKPLPQHFNILKPFSKQSWLGICGCVVMAASLRYVLFKFVLDKEKFDKSFQEAMYCFVSCLDQSVPDLRPNKRCSSFIMAGCWLFFTTLIIMGYKCNFRALLISVDHEPPINNAQDLIKYDRPLYIDDRAAILKMLKESSHEVFRELHKRMEDNNQFFKFQGDIPLSMEMKIKNEGAVITMTELMFQVKAWDLKRKYGSQLLRRGDEPFMMALSGFAVRKNDCLKPLLDRKLQYMIQSGIIAKVVKDNLPNPIIRGSKEQENDDDEVLTTDHIFLANCILVTGLTISGVIFVTERKLGPNVN